MHIFQFLIEKKPDKKTAFINELYAICSISDLNTDFS